VGEGTTAARSEVLAAREALGEELIRLEASFRAAIDVPAKVRKHPVKAAGLAAGAGFVAFGGPRKVLRRAKRAVFGAEAPLPTSMLPDEIEASLKALGTDGDRVRGLVEREFAAYLEQQGPQIRRRDLSRTGTILAVAALRPLVLGYSKKLADQIFSNDQEAFASRLSQVRARLGADAKPKDASEAGPTTPSDRW
jgi:hypothetical protein